MNIALTYFHETISLNINLHINKYQVNNQEWAEYNIT